MPDPDKTGGEYVHEESADELVCRDNDGSVACGIMIVSGFEYDPAVGQIRDAAIGDGHAVGVAADVVEKLLGASERLLAVNDPFLASSLAEEPEERLQGAKMGEGVRKGELSLPKSVLQSVAEKLSDPHGESLHGYKEVEARGDPAG